MATAAASWNSGFLSIIRFACGVHASSRYAPLPTQSPGARVLRTEFLHSGQVNRECDRQGQQGRQGGAAAQGEDHPARLRRGDAERFGRKLSRLHRLRIAQGIEQLGERRCSRGGERAPETGHDLHCVQCLAIGPAQLLAQVEGPGAAVGGNIPALSDAGDQAASGIFRHQAFVKVAQHVAAGHFLATMRVERGRFRAVAALQLERLRCLRHGIDGTQKQQGGNDGAHRLRI